MPRSCFAAFISLLLPALTSCGRSHSPTAVNTEVESVIAKATAQASAYEFVPARFHVQIDPGLGSAIVTPVREAAGPQAKSFDLDIANFTNEESFVVTGVQVLNANELEITFTHAHPFSSIVFENPTTSTNRADLGYTGRLVILADGNAQSFFGGEVTLDPSLVIRPDGYVNTGDLLAATGLANDTFPYVMLADEKKDNRVGIASGPRYPKGNYDANIANGGWNAANIVGPTENNGWTGFDFVHQGQTIENSFILDLNTLSMSSFDFDVALLIKYTDPRGTTGKTNRRPLATPNNLLFCYRLPFAALDCSVISAGPKNCEVTQTLGDTLHVAVGVRDYDAAVEESGDADLSDELNQLKVPPGTSAFAKVEADMPDLSSTVQQIAAQSDSGTVTDQNMTPDPQYTDYSTRYRGSIENENGSLAPGNYYGCIRVTDQEEVSVDRAMYQFGVDPVTLVGSPARALAARTYQVLPYTVLPSTAGGWGRIMTAATYPTGPTNGFLEATSITPPSISFARAVVDPLNGDVVVSGLVQQFVDFDPGPAEAANEAGTKYDPGFIARYSPQGTLVWLQHFGSGTVGGSPLIITDLTIDATGASFICGYVSGVSDINPGAGVLNSPGNGSEDAFVMKLDAAGSFQWGFFVQAAGSEGGLALAMRPTGDPVVAFQANGADFDPGPGTATLPDPFAVAAYTAAGTYQWSRGFNTVIQQLTSNSGRIEIGGGFSGLQDFDPGPGTANATAIGLEDYYLVRLDLSGDYLAHFTSGAALTNSRVLDLASTPLTTYIGGANRSSSSGTFDLNPAGGTDLQPISGHWLFALSSGGTYQWGRSVIGTTAAEPDFLTSTGMAVSADPVSGVVAVTTWLYNSSTVGLNYSPVGPPVLMAEEGTGTVHQFTSAGAMNYGKAFYASAPSALALGSGGQVYLAGDIGQREFPNVYGSTPAASLGPNGEMPLGDADGQPLSDYVPGWLMRLQPDGSW